MLSKCTTFGRILDGPSDRDGCVCGDMLMWTLEMFESGILNVDGGLLKTGISFLNLLNFLCLRMLNLLNLTLFEENFFHKTASLIIVVLSIDLHVRIGI